MNTRKLTKVMLGILAVLCLLIALSALKNKNADNNLEEDEIYDGEENITSSYQDETNIEIINFFNLYDYFETNEDCENMESYLALALKDYGTKASVFDTTNISFDENLSELTFNLESKTINIDEQYKVTVKRNETLLERIK